MGSICSPDNTDPNAVVPNTAPRGRPKNAKNGLIEDSIATKSTSRNETTAEFSTSKEHSNNDGLNGDYLSDLETDEQQQGFQQMQNESSTQKKKKGFQIIVTPADDPYADTTELEEPQFIDAADIISDTPDTPTDYNYDSHSKDKSKFDTTLGGKISWRKVADFSALLPRDVKLKLWNSIFKTDPDYNQTETKRISKILKTFVMLHLAREYKRTNSTVPSELKQELSAAVKEPSKFIASFLKRDENFIDQALLTIYDTICAKFKTDNGSKKAKYAKKAKMSQDNYAELTREDLKIEFNRTDFLKTAFLQYMLYAFQIKLDTESRKEYSD